MRTTAFALGCLALAACTSTGADTGTAGTTSSTSTTTSTTSSTTTSTTTSTTSGGSVVGEVTECDGTPLGDLRLTLCNYLGCRFSSTDAAGGYAFTGLEPGDYSLDALPGEEDGRFTVLVPVELAQDEARAVDLRVPTIDNAQAMPGSTEDVEIADGLTVTLKSGDLDLDFGDVTDIAGTLVDAGCQPEGLVLPGGVTPVAMWYLHPYDAHAVNGGVPYEMENLWGLSPAEELEVWVGVYDAFDWVSAGTVTVTGDGTLLENLDGTGLPVFSTVVLAR